MNPTSSSSDRPEQPEPPDERDLLDEVIAGRTRHNPDFPMLMQAASGRNAAAAASPSPMALDEPSEDLSNLPPHVRAAAVVFANGEVAWRSDAAGAAIDALAADGLTILGLDARTLTPDGTIFEVPISALQSVEGEAADARVDRAREEAVAALPLAIENGDLVLITWVRHSPGAASPDAPRS